VSALDLRQLGKTFPNGTEAVKGLDLTCADGEFVVLLGPSGCGKTTTLRMIAGLQTPTTGTVHIGGRDVTARRPAQRDVGFVFQFYGLYPHMTVRENILFPLACVGMPRAERRRRVDEVAGRMRLDALLGRFPRQLSGGDQQRVALARAIVRRPAVYLMDEPLGTLDADQRLDMREYIRDQQLRMKVTTVYVTHDQEEAMSLADRIVVMAQGRICQVGPPMTVYADPASLFVADFVGSPGMNFIPGTVRAGAGRGEFLPAGGGLAIPLPRTVPPGQVTLGIRPEYVCADPRGPVAGEVVMQEYQGDFRIVHLATAFSEDLVMRTAPADAHPPGERLRVLFDPDHVRLFRSDTGDAL
jgi:ABC-type sugar transport system ATPase subunit